MIDLPTTATYGDRGPCAAYGGVPTWYTASDSGHVCAWRVNESWTFELHQDGSGIGCGPEFDTFVEPNTHVYPDYPAGARDSPPFDQVKQLKANIVVLIAFYVFSLVYGVVG